MSLNKDRAESNLCNSRGVGEADLPATWSHPDSLEADVKGRYIILEWVINERVESRRLRPYCVNTGDFDECRHLQFRISCACRCYCTNHMHSLDGLSALEVGCSTN